MKTTNRCLFVAVALAFGASAAMAATDTDTMEVSAEIVASCDVTTGDLAFGQIDPLLNAGSATDSTTDITVTCSNTTPYQVGLNGGGAADVAAREMSDGTNPLSYALFSDLGRTANWGETADVDTVPGTGTGTAAVHTVYGRLNSAQNTAPVGLYSDSVTVTVTY